LSKQQTTLRQQNCISHLPYHCMHDKGL